MGRKNSGDNKVKSYFLEAITTFCFTVAFSWLSWASFSVNTNATDIAVIQENRFTDKDAAAIVKEFNQSITDLKKDIGQVNASLSQSAEEDRWIESTLSEIKADILRLENKIDEMNSN